MIIVQLFIPSTIYPNNFASKSFLTTNRLYTYIPKTSGIYLKVYSHFLQLIKQIPYERTD